MKSKLNRASQVFASLMALFLVFFCFSQCSQKERNESTQSGLFPFSDSHIDYAMLKRDSSCCQAKGKRLAIAAGGTHSARCGLKVSEQKGNIVDAAVATAFCLSVERGFSAGIGGGGFLTLHLRDSKGKLHQEFLDFRETAPKSASRDMYLDPKKEVIPDLSVLGAMSVATPGFVAGFYELHKRYGKLKWEEVVRPSIILAREGFAIYPGLADRFEKKREILLKDGAMRKLYFDERLVALKEGQILKQPDLAKTLEILAGKDGVKEFYQGSLGKTITDFLAQEAKRKGRAKGFVTLSDLKTYEKSGVKFRAPLRSRYRGYDILTAPPPSAGGVVLLQALNTLDGFDVKQLDSYTRYLHLLAEALKRGFADRARWVGDPDFFTDKTYQRLLTPEHASRIRSLIRADRATPSNEIQPTDFSGKARESENTTQLSLIDAEGNAVSSTITINSNFGSGLMVPGTGIILNNEMDDFSVKTGARNVYGLTGEEANSIAPLKRPVSSMSPTILFQNDRPVLVVGAAGGSQISSVIAQVVLNYAIVYPGNLYRAMFAPRIHQQWSGANVEKLMGEWKGISSSTQNELKAIGHILDVPPFLALAESVSANWETQELFSVFDPRDEGGAVAQ